MPFFPPRNVAVDCKMRIFSVSLRGPGMVTPKLGDGNPMPCNLLGVSRKRRWEGWEGWEEGSEQVSPPHTLLDQLRLPAACSCPQTNLPTSYKCVFALTSLPRNLSLRIMMAWAKHIALKMFFTALLVIFKSQKSSKCQQWALSSGVRGWGRWGGTAGHRGRQMQDPEKLEWVFKLQLLCSLPAALAKSCLPTCLTYER